MAMIPSDWFARRRRTDAFDPFSTDLWDPFQDYFPSTLSFPRPWLRLTERHGSVRECTRRLERNSRGSYIPSGTLGVEEGGSEGGDGGVLQISGERVRDQEEKTDTWHRMERSSGRFVRRFRLPDDAKFDQVKASITVPKTPGTKPEVKTIDIA